MFGRFSLLFLSSFRLHQRIQQIVAVFVELFIKTSPIAENAVLLDVRDGSEYAAGHIPGSVNLPLSLIDTVTSVYPDRSKHLYVYCYSGARSGQAANYLRKQGYTNVSDIGGIKGYTGATERGPK